MKYSLRSKQDWSMVRKIHSIMPYTLVGIGGLEATYKLAMQMNAEDIPGDFVELGVARGGCAALLGISIFDAALPARMNRKLWLFDSYEGLPAPTENDFGDNDGKDTGPHLRPLSEGSCLGTLEEVKNLLLIKNRFPEDDVVFVKGWFEDTVPRTRDRIKQIAVLRIDGDWYESTRTCLEGLYDKVAPGGAVVVDDYESCYGCKKAVCEFIEERRLHVEIALDGRGGCYFLKPKK